MKRKITIGLLLTIVFSIGGYLLYLHSDPIIKISNLNTEVAIENNFEKNSEKIDTKKIHYLENIPVVYIENNGYKAGLHHGKLLKQQIQDVVNILDNEILRKNTVKGFLIDTYLLQKAKQLDKHIPQIYREEMKGIAEGAKISYNDVLLINTYDDLLYLASCSSIAVSKNDKNSLFFHARNLDYPINVLSDKNIIFHYLDKKIISVGFPGYIGALSSTNYHGISLSSQTATVQKNSIGVPTGIIYRKIMEEANTFKKVESILKNNQRTIGNNLVVSSFYENQVAVFEITADNVVKLSDKDYAIATNHFVSPELSVINRSMPNSIKRYNYLDNFFQNSENINVDKIKETMSFFDGNQKSWSSIANKGTVQSVIFLPEQKIIYVAKGVETPVNKDGYVEYNYGQIITE